MNTQLAGDIVPFRKPERGGELGIPELERINRPFQNDMERLLNRPLGGGSITPLTPNRDDPRGRGPTPGNIAQADGTTPQQVADLPLRKKIERHIPTEPGEMRDFIEQIYRDEYRNIGIEKLKRKMWAELGVDYQGSGPADDSPVGSRLHNYFKLLEQQMEEALRNYPGAGEIKYHRGYNSNDRA